MKRAIVLCGASGTGKTHARMNDPALKNLPHVDVADFYREFPELDGASATAAGCRKARQLLEAHDAIVIKGYYLVPTHRDRRQPGGVTPNSPCCSMWCQ
jgi:hypothetical protein